MRKKPGYLKGQKDCFSVLIARQTVAAAVLMGFLLLSIFVLHDDSVVQTWQQWMQEDYSLSYLYEFLTGGLL